MQKILDTIYTTLSARTDRGQVASYIPELASVNPNQFGICVALADGRVFSAGDADVAFSIQSISKVFTLTLALGKLGDQVWQHVGREPSGDPFNSIVQLEKEQGKPRNPFINAGAIAICDAILMGHKPKEALGEIVQFVRFLADDTDIVFDAAVARSTALATRYVIYEFALVAGQALVQRGLGLLRATLGARLSVDINVLILEKALTLSLSHFEDTQFYDQLTRARREASSRPLAMVTDTFQLGQNLLTLLGYAALLLAFGPLTVVGLLLSAIPAAVAEMRFSRAAFRLRNWRAPETRRLNYIEYVLANDQHVKEVKL
ncbi:MAG TPA: glutaminase, partial [Marinagarivorans sp.]|nr:glutaminase [Marinagarivorans sp.]